MFTFLVPSLSDFFFFFDPFLLGVPLAKLDDDNPVPESEADVTLPFFPLVVGVAPIELPIIPDPTNALFLIYSSLMSFLGL